MVIRSLARARIAIALIALALLGAVAGVTADRLLHRPAQHHAARLADGTVVRFADLHTDPAAAIERVLELRPSQRDRIAAILERRQAEVDAAWHEARSRMHATVESVIAEIEAELDPDQATRFRALADELHGVHREHLFQH